MRFLALTMSTINLVLYMDSVTFVALHVLMEVPYWATLVLYTIITTIYTSFGGMTAVVWTDVFPIVVTGA